MQKEKNSDVQPAVRDIWLRLVAVISDMQGFTSRYTDVYTCSFNMGSAHVCIVKCWSDEVVLCYTMPENGRRRIYHFYAGEEINYTLIENAIMIRAGQIIAYRLQCLSGQLTGL